MAPYLADAIVHACLFALMAIGLTLIYVTTKVPNFAYGSFVTIGLYTSYTLYKVDKLTPYYSSVVAFVITAAASAAMYLLVLRPMARRGSSLVSQMIATFGVDIAFVGIFGIYSDYLLATYHLDDTKQFQQIQADFSVVGTQGIVLMAPLVLIAIAAGLYLLLTRTKFGVAMRASVENPPLARVLGINVDRVYLVSWLLAGGFAGMAGGLYTLWLPGGTDTGSVLIVEIFASSVLGGLSSLLGAVIGGLSIGGSEVVLGNDLAFGFGIVGAGAIGALLILIGVLLLRRKRPRLGILGIAGIILGAYVFFEIFTGYTSDLFVRELADGFGPGVIAGQKAIPLLIMAATLLLIPKGILSINWRRLLRREKKS